MANHFNELLLQTLKEISVRLDRLEGRTDRIIDQKVDKADLEATHKRLDDLDRKLDQKADKSDLEAIDKKIDDLREDMHSQGQRLDENIQSQEQRLREEIRSQGQCLDENIQSQGQRLNEDIQSQGQRLDRIEAGIGTLKWIIGAEVAVIGVVLAFIKAC